ncbi:MAG: glycosyltransferase family 2 protein [Candidatus Aminicenantes bacterium]|nr:glycosyltransferase family 2 protein [Candidatus Aminicenantes bacterium]
MNTLPAPLISVIVPVYRNESSLEELVARLRAALEPLSPDFEIILIEDCGGDGSWDVIRKLAAADARVLGAQFSRNFGQHYGISAGLDLCRGRWAVVMDADLQDRPEEIPALYRKALEGYDVVVARRIGRKHSPARRAASFLFAKAFSYMAHMKYDARVGNFRIVSARVVQAYRRMRETLRFFPALVEWMGFPAAAVDVVHDERADGRSAYSYRKLLRLAGDAVIAYSDKPLRLSVRLGFGLSLLSFLYGAFLIFMRLAKGIAVQGWTSLIVSVFFLGGIIIFLLGILGIYLIRTFDETKKRPLYILRETTRDGLDAPALD